jgi:hypothetical protein
MMPGGGMEGRGARNSGLRSTAGAVGENNRRRPRGNLGWENGHWPGVAGPGLARTGTRAGGGWRR